MARKGRFGRLPRAAPVLTATIVALLREYANTVDQAMLDAWKNGGEFDGAPVTDERLLGHFRKRRDELSSNDPNWDVWDNRLTQYTFAIEESQMEVKWANGQASVADMAAFYRKWEAKTADNTEFDRTLRKAVGQWQESANARAASGRARSKSTAKAERQSSVYENEVRPGDTLNAYLVELARALGVIPPADQRTQKPFDPAASGTNLSDSQLTQGDLELLLNIVDDGRYPDASVQAMVTQVTTAMLKVDPKFVWSKEYVLDTLDRARTGLDKMLEDPDLTSTERNGLIGKLQDISISRNRVAALDPLDDYRVARETYEREMMNSMNDPARQRQATERYLTRLATVEQQLQEGWTPEGTLGRDPALGAVTAERLWLNQALQSDGPMRTAMPPTVFDNTSGTSGQTGQDANALVDNINAMLQNEQVIRSGGWAEPDPQGGMGYIFHMPNEPRALGQIAVSPLRVGDTFVPVFATPVPVVTYARTPDNLVIATTAVMRNSRGEPIDIDGNVISQDDPKFTQKLVPDPLAAISRVSLPGSDGQPVSIWQSRTADGSIVYTPYPPTKPGTSITEVIGPNGVALEITPSEGDFQIGDTVVFGMGKYFTPPGIDLSAAVGRQSGVSPSLPSTMFLSADAAGTYQELTRLDPRAPNYGSERQRLMSEAESKADWKLAQAQVLRANGNAGAAAALEQDAQRYERDLTVLQVMDSNRQFGVDEDEGWITLLASQGQVLRRGTAGRREQREVIGDLGIKQGAVVRRSPGQEAAARAWLESQIDEYEQRVGSLPTPTSLPARAFATGGLGAGSIPADRLVAAARTATTPPPDLRSTIDRRIAVGEDPRTIKLPQGVVGVNAPSTFAQAQQTFVGGRAVGGTFGTPTPSFPVVQAPLSPARFGEPALMPPPPLAPPPAPIVPEEEIAPAPLPVINAELSRTPLPGGTRF